MSAPSRLPRGGVGAALTFVGLSVVAGILAGVAVTPAIALTGLATSNSIGMFENLPDSLRVDNLPERTTIYAHRTVDGKDQNVPIASFYAENRVNVGWDQVAQVVKDAAVAAEDPRFYEHGGVDPLGVARAALSNVLGSGVQGASTISQQYVKNILVAQATGLATPEEQEAAYEEATKVSLDRKLKEMRLAIGLEKAYSKDEILLGYLNIALFGGRVYGIQAAAQYYYGVNASDLDANQAATLIAIVNNPSNLRIDQPDDPDNGAANGYKLTKARRDYVLDSMLKHDKIDQATHDAAVAAPIEPKITPSQEGCASAGNAGYFCDYVVNVIRNDKVFGDSEDERYAKFIRGGFDVYTTLDLDLQDTAQNAINENVPMSMDSVDIASAATAVEAGTGKIKLMAQNKVFNDSGDAATLGPQYSAVNYSTDQNYGGSVGFQAASTYKAFTLIAYLRNGGSLNDRFDVTARTYNQADFKACDNTFGGDFEVLNDENERGSRTVMQSTATSINGAFLQMAKTLDQCSIRQAAQDLLVHPSASDQSQLSDNPTASIGDNNVSPLTMATAYAGIANHGYVCSPIAIERMVDQSGSDVKIPQSSCSQGIETDIADAAAWALKGVITGGSATASNPNDGTDHLAKTGTTNNATNTWTTGASTKIGLSVLVGQATGEANLRRVSLDSGSAATARHRIWKPIMTALDDRFGGDAINRPSGALITGKQTPVPDVTGLTADAAKQIIEGAGFTFADGGTRPDGRTAGQVVATDPAAGQNASSGATVTVFTSDGTGPQSTSTPGAPNGQGNQAQVPDTTGNASNTAIQKLTGAGFSANNVTFAYTQSGASAGNLCTVQSSNPAPGSSLSKTGSVTLTLFSPTGSAPPGGCPR